MFYPICIPEDLPSFDVSLALGRRVLIYLQRKALLSQKVAFFTGLSTQSMVKVAICACKRRCVKLFLSKSVLLISPGISL